MRFRASVALLLLVLPVACAGTAGTSSRAPSASNVISRTELDAAGSASALDVITRLRPHYLRDRGSTSLMNQGAVTKAVVFLDEREHGPIDALRSFAASTIEEIRYLPGPEATTKFGSRYGTGVILLRLRQR